ncbi:uncharacterized protein LOC120464222 [Pimephales promelas]|uniref:uncharacterized protein LOC120464222 n=1 Tax=Pimephales promelas TaxID=90988 RepID=UPI0019559C1C|nr:uncharacterized protein LOC120464222 [Pimephales promelas]
MDLFNTLLMSMLTFGTVVNHRQTNVSQRLQYSRDFLIQCNGSAPQTFCNEIPPEIRRCGPFSLNRQTEMEVRIRERGSEVYGGRRGPVAELRMSSAGRVRKRGRRGGVRRRLRRTGLRRLPLPSIILGNVQSLRNKVDELQANVKFIPEFKNACIIALTETWLKEHDPSQDFEIDGFDQPIRLDRDAQLTGKTQGGGVCLYVNSRWCKTIIVRESICSPHIELLSISLRPFYLPREIPQIFITLVYIHPRANLTDAVTEITKLVHRLQNISPDAPHFILGDFNMCSLKKDLGHFYQYVSCPTRHGKILDMCYGTVKDAYKSYVMPPLGSSDHSCVFLAPIYQSALRRGKVERKEVSVWTDDAIKELNGCFYSTDWDVFKDSCTDLDELTFTVTSYIKFCEQMIIPTKTITLYPNNKQWVSRSLKHALNKKKIAFQQNDIYKKRETQRLVKNEIKLAKSQFKDKVEDQLKNGNAYCAWRGIKAMVGMSDKKKSVAAYDKSDSDVAEELNQFYSRFDSHEFNDDLAEFRIESEGSQILIDEIDVWKTLEQMSIRKSQGPDCISGRLLKNCALFLTTIFTFIFQRSLSERKVPGIWKESVVVPDQLQKSPLQRG